MIVVYALALKDARIFVRLVKYFSVLCVNCWTSVYRLLTGLLSYDQISVAGDLSLCSQFVIDYIEGDNEEEKCTKCLKCLIVCFTA